MSWHASQTWQQHWQTAKKVLVVAEKPSVARAFKKALEGRPFLHHSNVEWRFGATNGHLTEMELDGDSDVFVAGGNPSYHDVPRLAELFEADVRSKLAIVKSRDSLREWKAVCHLAHGIDYLVLCLDRDLEGEAIANEVVDLLPRVEVTEVKRCRFSSLDVWSLRFAMSVQNLCSVNKDEVDAVRARRVLDLKVGKIWSWAFSKLVHNHIMANSVFKERVWQLFCDCCLDPKNPKNYIKLFKSGMWLEDPYYPLWSYGPCQTPALGLLVKQHIAIKDAVRLPRKKHRVHVPCPCGDKVIDVYSEWQEDAAAAELLCERLLQHVQGAEAPEIRARKSERKICKGFERPRPLNTVRLLQLADTALGMLPWDTLQVAEALYLEGCITYPRTETSCYPASLPLTELVGGIADAQSGMSAASVAFARRLQQTGITAPRQDGDFVGDHEPIVPCLGGQRPSRKWRKGIRHWQVESLFDLIVRHFLASVAPDCIVEETTVTFDIPFGGCWQAVGYKTIHQGWIEILPILEPPTDEIPDAATRAVAKSLPLEINSVRVESVDIAPPSRLTPAELIQQMDAHGLGTDATMAGHIFKLIDRGFARLVKLDAGQGPSQNLRPWPLHWELEPTELGLILFHWFMVADGGSDMVFPSVRAMVEEAYQNVAKGVRSYESVLNEFIPRFKGIFEEMFAGPRSNRLSATLRDFMGLPFVELENNARWRQAQDRIREAKFDEMAEDRARRLQIWGDHMSEPASHAPKQCLMLDAEVLDGRGQTVRAADLGVGSSVVVVFEQEGLLIQGFCDVERVAVLEARDRDVAFITIATDEPQQAMVTSHHCLMGRTLFGLAGQSWGPIPAVQLKVNDEVAFFPAADDNVQPVRVRQRKVAREPHLVVLELELNSGIAALRLQLQRHGQQLAPSVGCFGEAPRVLNPLQHYVIVYHFSRGPRDVLHERFSESPELAPLRHTLRGGGTMFVHPEHTEAVRACLERRGIGKPSQIAMAPDLEERVRSALRLTPARECVRYPRRSELVSFSEAFPHVGLAAYEATVGDDLGHPFVSYLYHGNHLVQFIGRRGHVEIRDIDSDEERVPRARSI